jgi:hypothetical protein
MSYRTTRNPLTTDVLQIAGGYIAGDRNHRNHSCEKLKSYKKSATAKPVLSYQFDDNNYYINDDGDVKLGTEIWHIYIHTHTHSKK